MRALPENRNAGLAPGVGRELVIESWKPIDSKRSARRQRQTAHLHRCGERCLLEALIAVEGGEPLDSVLADFERLPPQLYHAALYHYAALDNGGPL